MPKTTSKTVADRPHWPYAHITLLTPDARRNQWVKKIRGNLYSFGVIWPVRNGQADPQDNLAFVANAQKALQRWQTEGPALHAGLTPEVAATGQSITVGDICGWYLQAKTASAETGALSHRTLRDYEAAIERIVKVFGKHRPVAVLRPIDFERLLRSVPFGPTRRGNFVIWVKQVFAWAHDSELCDTLPRFGKAFRGITTKERRRLRHRAGKNLLSASQIHDLLDRASDQMKAMILLGINGGMGNTDCASLPASAIDPRKKVIDFPRPKTSVERRIPLWPETAAAIEAVVAARGQTPGTVEARAARDLRGLVFVTRFGSPWVHGTTDAVGQEFAKLIGEAGIARTRRVRDDQGKERVVMPLGFYTLRRTFRTIADDAGDQHATLRIMGQTIPGMSGVYVQKIDDARLRRVTNHVRAWFLKGRRRASKVTHGEDCSLPSPGV